MFHIEKNQLSIFEQAEGQTALHITAQKGDEYTIRTLFKAGANPSIIDLEGQIGVKLEKYNNINISFECNTIYYIYNLKYSKANQ